MRRRRPALVGMLLFVTLVLLRGGLALETGTPTAADRLWDQAIKAADRYQWDEARKLLEKFMKKHPDDPRAGEARTRLSGNIFLKAVPYCVSGPKENRIDLYMSADGLLATQADQDALKHIVDLHFEEALRLAPFDAYWSYFNWYRVHAASANHGPNLGKGKESKTCFGGHHGYKDDPGGDAWVDHDLAHDFQVRHLPDCDFFLVWSDGWNGWPVGWGINAIGSTNFRYVPMALSNFRLYEAELGPGGALPYPELQERFDRWKAGLDKTLETERDRCKNLTVRQWREMTAAWNKRMIGAVTYDREKPPRVGKRDGAPRGDAVRRKPEEEPAIRMTRVTVAEDMRDFPPDMDPRERPFPTMEQLRGLPWYHWLVQGDPSVTLLPIVQLSFPLWWYKHHPIKKGDPWESAISPPDPKRAPRQYAHVIKTFNGLPDKAQILKLLRLVYHPHERCHLAGGSTPALGGYNTAPQYCALCREETVRAIYRHVSPIDGSDPPEEKVAVDPQQKVDLAVYPMKPLDHYLAVEWKIDGKPAAGIAQAKRTLLDRKTGKAVPERKLPPFPAGLRQNEIFFNAKNYDAEAFLACKSGATPAQLESAFAHARVAVKETLSIQPGKLPPGEHTVEVTVTDETPWVLWDPENLLTESRTWTLVVPEPELQK